MNAYDEELLAAIEAHRDLARRKLLPFVLWTKPDYIAGWVHYVICEKLDKFIADSVAGKSPRLMLCMPPRHGKSQLASVDLPAFFLGLYPEKEIIFTSYSGGLASDMNRGVQRVIDSDEYRMLFPKTQLSASRSSRDGAKRTGDTFEIVGNTGVYRCAGIGGPITGKGGHILIIDDPVANAEAANSETIRKSTWDWYTSTLLSRQAPGAGVLLIQTRWHMDDLAGRILENMKKGGEQWDVAMFPAVAEEDEEYRLKGEALHPERYSLDMLMRIKQGTEEEPGVGSKTWSALYQQRPSAAEGNIFKREHWKFLRAPKLVSEMQPDERRRYFRELGINQIIQRWDTALGTKKLNDYSACATLGCTKSRYYLVDVWSDRIEFPEVTRQVELQRDRWSATKVKVEGGGSASGKATVQTVKRETNVPVSETPTITDKVTRAELISPNHESGLIYLFEGPNGEKEPWHAKFIDNCANFPSLKFDDDVDAFIGAMEEATAGRRPMQIADGILKAAAYRADGVTV